MAFFDKVSRKISDFADDTSDKVKEFGKTNKLKTSISEEERKLEVAYIEIGKDYFEKNQNQEETAYVAAFAQIRESKAKILEMQAELDKIKEDTKDKISKRREDAQKAEEEPVSSPVGLPCPSCGFRSALNSRFCSECGKPLSA